MLVDIAVSAFMILAALSLFFWALSTTKKNRAKAMALVRSETVDLSSSDEAVAWRVEQRRLINEAATVLNSVQIQDDQFPALQTKTRERLDKLVGEIANHRASRPD